MSESGIREFLRADLAGILPVSDDQIEALASHYELMARWNARLNLTRVVDPQQASRKHYGESALIARILPPGPLEIADFGSGAGFPGIPIGVLRPDIMVTLIESHQRKSVFLREASRDLPNVRVTASRGDAVARRFDWVVSRAVRWEGVLRADLAPSVALLLSANDGSAIARVEGFTWNVQGALSIDDRLVTGRMI